MAPIPTGPVSRRDLDELRDQLTSNARAIIDLATVVDGHTTMFERFLGPDGTITACFDELLAALKAAEARVARLEERVQSPTLKRF